MQYYIGVKQIQAEPQERQGWQGYRVVYPDGYVSWSPKDVFERAYLPMGEGSDGTKINQGMVDGFIDSFIGSKMGEKTTVVCATLKNGFEFVESSSCVDAANYSQEMGESIVANRLKDRIWMLLGFLLQTARNGVGTK